MERRDAGYDPYRRVRRPRLIASEESLRSWSLFVGKIEEWVDHSHAKVRADVAYRQNAAGAFYRVIDTAYKKRSVALTSNLHPAGFDTIMPKTLATAAVDSFLHHAQMVLTDGPPSASKRQRPERG